ncbi:MAG: SOS response-associated peptidase [Acidimicrobiales bacterium]
MCGRFVSSSPPDELARYFDATQVTERVIEPSFNVAPTEDVFVVVERGGVRRLDAFRWGLIPFWAKEPKVGQKMINARAEGLVGKSAYRNAFKKKRCLIPANGFFEWMRVPGQKAKQPMFVHRVDGEPIAFAGLWEMWRPPELRDDDQAIIRSCTIITGDPNDKVAEIHDRMPVMLPPSAWDAWLDSTNDDLDSLGALLLPAPSELLELHPVSTAVNDVRQDGPALIEPMERDQGRLL